MPEPSFTEANSRWSMDFVSDVKRRKSIVINLTL